MPVLAEAIIALGFGQPDTKALDTAVEKGEDGAKKVGTSWANAAKKTSKAMAVMATASIAAVAGVVKLADSMTALVDAQAKAARNAGISSGEFQKLEFAMKRGGVTGAELTKTLQFIDRQLTAARFGAGQEFVDALDVMGLSIEDMEGTASERLGLLADGLDGITDKSTKTGIAMMALGDTAILSAITGGATALDAIGKSAERYGIILDEKALAAAEAFQDEMLDTKETILGLVKATTIALLPSISQAVRGTREWTIHNRELVASVVDISGGTLFAAFDLVAPILENLAVSGVAASNVMGTLSEDIDGKMIPALTALGIAAGVAAGPWGVLGAAILTVAANLDKLLGSIGGEAAFNKLLGAAGRRIDKQGDTSEMVLRTEGGRIRDVFTTLPDANLGLVLEDLDANALAREVAFDILYERGKIAKAAAGKKEAAERAKARLKAISDRRKAGLISASIAKAEVARRQKQARDLFGEEIGFLAEREGLGSIAIEAAVDAAAGSLAGGSTDRVARVSALSRLGGLAGVSLATPATDPLISDLFGDNVPEARLSTLALGSTPQVIKAAFSYRFDFQNEFEINGATGPQETAQAVAAQIRQSFEADLVRSTNLAKVRFAR